MKTLALFSLCCICLAGCANLTAYDPMHMAQTQTLLLNESALKKVAMGMDENTVHGIMGQTIVIGYTAGKEQGSQYEPLTITNPYKSEKIFAAKTEYLVEYYVKVIHHPDGIVSDDELEPLIFKEGRLAGKGWDDLKLIRSWL